MNLSKQTLDKIIEALNSEKQNYQSEIDRIDKDISELLETDKSIPPKSQSRKHKKKQFAVKKETMTAILTKLFEDKKPRLSRDLNTHYNLVRGTAVNQNSFSSQLSTLVNKRKVFKKQTFPENPNETMHYYGMPEWFEGDKFKPEYLQRIETNK